MDMSKYKGMFLSETREHLGNMNQMILALEKDPDEKGNIDSLFRAAHSIKGMAASMGYEEITELAHKMEDFMDRFRKEELTISRDATDVLLEGHDALETLVNAVEKDAPSSIDVAPLIERFKNFNSSSAAGKDSVVSETATVDTPAVRPEPSEAKKKGNGFYDISVQISPDSGAPSARAFLVLRKIKEMGAISSTEPAEEVLKSGRFSGTLKVRVMAEALPDGVEDIIGGVGEVISVAVEKGAMEEPQAKDAERKGKKRESNQTREAKQQDLPREHELPKVIKVNTSTLDYFVNAVGELIINKSMLHDISRRLGSKELADGLGLLDRLVRDLQIKVMGVRTMPLGSITERFPRVVRDLARKQGKDVEFVVEGDDIELDRSILEGLGNPLTHIIRNCIDHGIEPPDERKKLGKDQAGRIMLRALREKDQAIIEVSDDGRGMDPDRIKRAALEKGLISEDDAAEMSDADALYLVCLPGFSTAKEVSDVSGRGVGMDAVKAGVEPIGGSLEISSRVGEGSLITLNLPLTVAIMHSLLVQAGSETYAVPITRILRTLEVESSEIKVSQRQRYIDVDGMITPLYTLRGLLRLEEAEDTERYIPVVVVEQKGRTVALQVDRLVGQQETFVKQLERPLNRISGLSGTTVLGNGKTIFLLDVTNLMQ